MASLHAWRGGSLPEKREELYANAVDLLLEQWERPKRASDNRREPGLSEWLNIDRDRLRSALEEIAYNAHASQPSLQGTANIAEGDLITALIKLNPNVNPLELRNYLSQRAGLLITHGVGMYTFPHRTFQEYLAARYLTTYKFPTELARLTRTDPERWREAALLAAAKSKGGADYAMWGLVDRLCRHDATDKSTVEDHWGALVAGQALAETVDPALKRDDEAQDEIFERVQNWQVHILKSSALPAIERTYAGDSLATLGDPRFDANHWHLPKESLWGFVEIPEGEFIMGDDEDDRAKPQHKLKLLRYFIARYPTTVAQFKSLLMKADTNLKTQIVCVTRLTVQCVTSLGTKRSSIAIG